MSEEKRKEVVLITGGSGLIGDRLARILSESYQVIGLDLAPNHKTDKRVENIGFDITDDSSIKAALNRVKYNYGSKVASIIHLAAYYDFNGKDSPMYNTITVEGTRKLLKHLKEVLNVEQFLFSSTNLVYKPCNSGEKIEENSPLEPDWAYPESKVKTEKVISEEHGEIKAVIARIAGVYDEWGHSIPLSHQVERINEKKITGHLYSGSTEKGNAFIHLNDLLEAIELIVDKRKLLSNYEVFNISEGTTYSYGVLQNRLGELIHGEEWTTLEVPKPIAKAGAAVQDAIGDPFIKPWMIDRADDHYELDISKAERELGWKPKHDLMAVMKDMVGNLKKDPEKWYLENNLEPPKTVKQEP